MDLPMSSLRRILDANANRAREALRVMEEAARFHLEEAALAADLKELRHAVSRALSRLGPLDDSRDVAHDVGTETTTPAEMARADLAAVALAAGRRLGEALRCLEEYGKVLDADAAAAIERSRYRAYELEQRLQRGLRAGRARQWAVCAIVSEERCGGRPWLDVARRAIEGGAECVQLREKSLGGAELLRRAEALVRVAGPAGATVIVNDRPDVALAAGADGVHLGQEDLPVTAMRRIPGPRLLAGVSTSRLGEAIEALRDGADYCGVGPMFPTSTKVKERLAGPGYLREYVAWGRLPHLAIGGITVENVGQLVEAGVRGVAVCSAVCGAADAAAVVRELRRCIDGRT
jgi:thiamine-phosphate pyrophosphorylase